MTPHNKIHNNNAIIQQIQYVAIMNVRYLAIHNRQMLSQLTLRSSIAIILALSFVMVH